MQQSDLKALISYDPETGAFKRISSGKPIGGLNAHGYVQMSINKQFYYGHRLAWFLTHGEWPERIDHINGNPSDNRLENLRPATHRQNMFNARMHIDNQIGFKGIDRTKGERWRARIKANGKVRHLGVYDTKEAAHAAYVKAAEQYFGEFARAA